MSTGLGRVAYRTIGSGPPLLLIIGYRGIMEHWDRRLVDALARQHRAITFDNAGVGRTQALRAPLTIDAMADQTSALIGALHLGRTDVLGWSMGGMIAHALAVRHPSQVRRLVLCATAPGNGAAVPLSRQVPDAFETDRLETVLATLFPAGRSAHAHRRRHRRDARLQLYPDASHAFLFQDQATFLRSSKPSYAAERTAVRQCSGMTPAGWRGFDRAV